MNSYTITNPTDIFSLIMNVYGTLEQSVSLLSGNATFLPSFETDISSLAGQQLVYDPLLVTTYLSPQPVLPTPASPVTEFTWQGREGQNLFDVCIQTYGVLDEQIKLMNDNNIDFSVVVYRQLFTYDSTLIDNSSTWNRTTGMGVIFSTGDSLTGSGSYDDSFEISSFEDGI